MFISPQEGLVILEHYRYLVIFPVMVLEGPIITVISGFLVYLGLLNVFFTYFLLVVGDLLGDVLHYVVGKYGIRSKRLKHITYFLGYDEVKEKLIEEHFDKHLGKTIILAKISHGVGGIVQIVAGVARVDFFKFLWFSFLGTLPKTLILLLLGYYLGNSYLKIDTYFDRIALFTFSFVFFGLLYLVSRKLVRNFLNKKQ